MIVARIMIDKDTVDKIKDAANIVEVVGEYVNLIKRGTNYVGLCPFHEDHNPSFYVNPARGTCHCYVCGEGGDSIAFLRLKLGLTYPEALRKLAEKYNIEIPHARLPREQWFLKKDKEAMYATNKAAMDYYADSLANSDEAKAYFTSRGITAEMIEKFKLGFAPCKTDIISVAKEKAKGIRYLLPTGADVTFKSGNDLHVTNGVGIVYQLDNGMFHDRFAGRVIFPWRNKSSKVVGFGGRKLDVATHGVSQKYVNSPESVIYHKDHELYGLYEAKDAIRHENRVYLVEGYLDVIMMHQIGIENVVANSGTALSEHQISLLSTMAKKITLVYDSDDAGVKAALRSLDMLAGSGMSIRILLLPEGEDPASFVQAHDAEAVQKYFRENQQDMVHFMRDVLIRKATDVESMTEAIEYMRNVISEVPNRIERELYIRELESATGMTRNLFEHSLTESAPHQLPLFTPMPVTSEEQGSTSVSTMEECLSADVMTLQQEFDSLSENDKIRFAESIEDDIQDYQSTDDKPNELYKISTEDIVNYLELYHHTSLETFLDRFADEDWAHGVLEGYNEDAELDFWEGHNEDI